jgi:hypothetical protein
MACSRTGLMALGFELLTRAKTLKCLVTICGQTLTRPKLIKDFLGATNRDMGQKGLGRYASTEGHSASHLGGDRNGFAAKERIICCRPDFHSGSLLGRQDLELASADPHALRGRCPHKLPKVDSKCSLNDFSSFIIVPSITATVLLILTD